MSPRTLDMCDQLSPNAVLLTPPGRGAVATILVEGPGALAAVTAFQLAQMESPLCQTPMVGWLSGDWATNRARKSSSAAARSDRSKSTATADTPRSAIRSN